MEWLFSDNCTQQSYVIISSHLLKICSYSDWQSSDSVSDLLLDCKLSYGTDRYVDPSNFLPSYTRRLFLRDAIFSLDAFCFQEAVSCFLSNCSSKMHLTPSLFECKIFNFHKCFCYEAEDFTRHYRKFLCLRNLHSY